MNYIEVVNYIESKMKFGCRPGLERTSNLLELLGNPHKDLKVIHIAGTNGKGSTTAMIANILKHSGYKVGMYISPHLYSNTERMSINGLNISEEDFTDYALRVIDKVNYMKINGLEEPTQFEMYTAMALLYFKEKNVDFAVIEVGLGGKLDATNVVNSIISVITSISYDHTDILGDTIEKIALEKSGIIKNNTVCVMYPQMYKDAERVIEDVCKIKNVKLVKVEQNNTKQLGFDIDGQIIEYLHENKKIDNIRLALIGHHQVYNAATAITAVLELIDMGYKINEAQIRNGLESVIWPCRLSLVSKKPLILIDGAHNEDGINALKISINDYFTDKSIILIIGMLKDKNYQCAIKNLAPIAHTVIATEPISPRALDAVKLAELASEYCNNVFAESNIEGAVDKALSMYESDRMICICGSLYLAGYAYHLLVNKI